MSAYTGSARPHIARSPRQWRKWLVGLFFSRYDGLDNFAVVEPGVLLRCGQPHVRDLDRIRREHGLSTIVCARGGTRHPLRGWWFRRQKAYCARHGIHLEHLPFSDARTPPADVFERFLELVQNASSRPMLVHCEQGFHRTGILCAAFRIAHCGWSLEAALEEMAAHGFDVRSPKRRLLADALQTWAAGRPEATACS